MRIAQEAQHRFGRHVSWGAECGDVRKPFTTVSVPAMTRLRMSERRVLDTLVEGGVARSRSHALACAFGWSRRSRMSGSPTCARRRDGGEGPGRDRSAEDSGLVRPEPHPVEDPLGSSSTSTADSTPRSRLLPGRPHPPSAAPACRTAASGPPPRPRDLGRSSRTSGTLDRDDHVYGPVDETRSPAFSSSGTLFGPSRAVSVSRSPYTTSRPRSRRRGRPTASPPRPSLRAGRARSQVAHAPFPGPASPERPDLRRISRTPRVARHAPHGPCGARRCRVRPRVPPDPRGAHRPLPDGTRCRRASGARARGGDLVDTGCSTIDGAIGPTIPRRPLGEERDRLRRRIERLDARTSSRTRTAATRSGRAAREPQAVRAAIFRAFGKRAR